MVCSTVLITLGGRTVDNTRWSQTLHENCNFCLPHLHSLSEHCYNVWCGKTRMVWLPGDEQISKIHLFVLTEYTNVADGRRTTASAVLIINIARQKFLDLQREISCMATCVEQFTVILVVGDISCGQFRRLLKLYLFLFLFKLVNGGDVWIDFVISIRFWFVFFLNLGFSFRGVARCCLPRFQGQPQHLKYQNWIFKKLYVHLENSGEKAWGLWWSWLRSLN